MNTNSSWKKNAAAIAAFLLILCLASLLSLLLPRGEETAYVAEIFQNGNLIMRIPLNGVNEKQNFTIEGENGCVNEIEVRPGCIAIISADCPDKLCVGQGFIRDSRLPVTCLPNRLVIQLIPASDAEEASGDSPDMISY